ncbi:23S rRNA (guanosine(2251)-2'-O)-methyltransferase RlmB [Candidatus Riesia pediculicola]|uniref:23S rRNA (guanosine(2251)-2'-O)-methyltransferase RlmB n=1 Tax=Candidatus Riesia pediculicola TaxID=401619 RepID=UPI0009C32D5F|nr:23S rRNA (guanosine(2251)-2'-O)-methyltransferase RlmB [Candidatus Riesia pediculicola]ARC54207.1 hypothetical protein AOE57_01155 [Candidatus Riesia pediculicola]
MSKKIIYGIHTVNSYLNDKNVVFELVYILKNSRNNRIFQIKKKLESFGVSIRLVNRRFLDHLSNYVSHQGILAVINCFQKKASMNILNEIPFQKKILFLILDGITDVRNLGSCLRTAHFFGVDAVIVPKNRSARINEIVEKVSCGASRYVPMIRTNLVNCIEKLKKYDVQVLGTDEKANRSIYDLEINEKKIAIIVGNEEKGIRQIIKKNCSRLFRIPAKKQTSSLNVSVTAGIFLFEVCRQSKDSGFETEDLFFDKNI